MALPFNQITAMTHALIEDSAADNFFDSNPLFYWLKEKGQVIYDGGTHLQEPIVYDDVDAAGSFANYDILDTSPNEQLTAAEANIRRYYVNIVISRHELLRASGKQAVINLLDSKVQVGNLTMADQVSTDIHSANIDSSTGAVGLQSIGKDSGTLHGIAPADAPTWVSSKGTLSGLTSTPALAADYMYFLNPSWLKMYVHRDDNFISTPFPVTPNQDVVGSRLTASLQLMCNNRRMQGYFDDIDPTA